jgi:type IV secretory pathway component VirB8
MNPEDKIIAQSIRDGSYFKASRGWFETVYIGPVSERAFFLLVAALAGFVAFSSIIALISLTPITSRPPIYLYGNDRPYDTLTRLVEIRKPSDEVNEAMIEFFLKKYVAAREGFSATDFVAKSNFVRAQSDEATYSLYMAASDPTNPNSWPVLLGQMGQRVIAVDSIRLSRDGENTSARVRFSAELLGVEPPAKTKWTAKIKFRYTEILITLEKNAETGKKEMRATDPQFQVVSYELEQN